MTVHTLDLTIQKFADPPPHASPKRSYDLGLCTETCTNQRHDPDPGLRRPTGAKQAHARMMLGCAPASAHALSRPSQRVWYTFIHMRYHSRQTAAQLHH